jgi:hypothetical protein
MNQKQASHHQADYSPDHGSSALTLVSLAHGVNHAQSALKPLVFPLVLRDLNFGYSELGIMLGVAAAVGGSLQLAAGALGRILPRHLVWVSETPRLESALFLWGWPRAFLSSFFGR